MSKCYAVGRTDQGEELRCCLARSHQGKTDHFDGVRDQSWAVDLVANPWAMAGISG